MKWILLTHKLQKKHLIQRYFYKKWAKSADESTDRPARGIPGAVANQAPLAADLQIDTPVEGTEQEFKQDQHQMLKTTKLVKNWVQQ